MRRLNEAVEAPMRFAAPERKPSGCRFFGIPLIWQVLKKQVERYHSLAWADVGPMPSLLPS